MTQLSLSSSPTHFFDFSKQLIVPCVKEVKPIAIGFSWPHLGSKNWQAKNPIDWSKSDKGQFTHQESSWSFHGSWTIGKLWPLKPNRKYQIIWKYICSLKLYQNKIFLRSVLSFKNWSCIADIFPRLQFWLWEEKPSWQIKVEAAQNIARLCKLKTTLEENGRAGFVNWILHIYHHLTEGVWETGTFRAPPNFFFYQS